MRALWLANNQPLGESVMPAGKGALLLCKPKVPPRRTAAGKVTSSSTREIESATMRNTAPTSQAIVGAGGGGEGVGVGVGAGDGAGGTSLLAATAVLLPPPQAARVLSTVTKARPSKVRRENLDMRTEVR